MRNYNLIQITLRNTIMILSCIFCFNLAIAQSTYYFYPGTSSTQKLYGDDNSSMRYTSNNSTTTGLIFYDKEGDYYGRIHGNANGGRFGLLDGDGFWSYQAVKGSYTAFLVSDTEMMRIKNDGNVGIGTTNPQHKLDVCGVIRAEEILVDDTWCDFVFEPEYCLTTLEEEEEFINLYGHLSNFESAKAMNGKINVNDIFKRQQIQIEENVLHLIELNEENNALQIQVNDLTDDVEEMKAALLNSNETIQALVKRIEALEAANQ